MGLEQGGVVADLADSGGDFRVADLADEPDGEVTERDHRPGEATLQAARLRDSRRRWASIPSDSRRMTSSEPSDSTSRVLAGMLFALFLTRQARSAPTAENRTYRSMDKNPRRRS